MKISAEDYRQAVASSADKKRLTLSDLSFLEKPVKENKYKPKKVEYGGHKFDSKWEYERYLILKALAAEGKIKDLIVHPTPFILQEGFTIGKKKIRAITYCPDFYYYLAAENKWIAEDTKGTVTEASRLRMKMFMSRYRMIELRVIKKK